MLRLELLERDVTYCCIGADGKLPVFQKRMFSKMFLAVILKPLFSKILEFDAAVHILAGVFTCSSNITFWRSSSLVICFSVIPGAGVQVMDFMIYFPCPSYPADARMR